MTKEEVLTRILEEGKRILKVGGSFTINNMLIANYYETVELRFVYEEDTDIIKMIHVLSEGRIILCIFADCIERISVSDKWLMRPGIGDTVYGRVNGERFSCNRRCN